MLMLFNVSPRFCCSAIFCKKDITAASFAAAIDLSCARISLSLLILSISCALHASSLATFSCSRFSIASKNLFCKSSCFSITSFINLSKKSFHFRFLFRDPSSVVSSEDVEYELAMELDNRSVEILGKDGRGLMVVGFVVDGWKLVEGLMEETVWFIIFIVWVWVVTILF